jgi:hypothetical protein
MKFPNFMENVKIVPGLNAQAGNGAGAADRVCLKDYEGCAILVIQLQGAADSENITFHKATAASAGTEDTSNAIPNWWKLEDVTIGTTADTWTKGTAVAAGAYIATSATASGISYYLIDIKAEELPDSTADYDFVEFNTIGAGSGSNYIDAIYLLYNPRYAQADLPSAQA